MSLRFQQLQSEVFEERALPSSVMISMSSVYQPMSITRVSEHSWAIRTAAPQYQAFFVNQQAYGVVPIGTLRDGRTLFMMVNVSPSSNNGVTLPPVSERLSAGATLTASNTQPESTSERPEVVAPVNRTLTRTTPNTQTDLMAYSPERSTTTNTLREQRRAAESPTVDEQQAPPVPTTANMAMPVLRDYSNIEQAAVLEPIMLDEPIPLAPPSEPMEPTMPEPEPEQPAVTSVLETSTLMPLAGLLPFNVTELDADAKEFLQRVARVGLDLADDVATSSEYWWLAAAAISAGGALLATRPTRTTKPIPTHSQWLNPENNHDCAGR